MVTATPIVVPFTVLVDTNEGNPFTFEGLRADAKHKYRPLIVPTEWRALGRYPLSLGDYSIDGFVGRVSVERKSMADCWGTVLGFDGSRERFESELADLATFDAACVVVEATMGMCLANMPTHGRKTVEQNQKSFFRSVLAYQQDYRVQWFFADNRRLAEQYTFRFLERFHRKQMELQKNAVTTSTAS